MLRTRTCGELRLKDAKKEATLCGWVHSRRDHGGVIFIDLRDRYGLTQIVFNPTFHQEAHAEAEKLKREDVLRVRGEVHPRAKGMANPNLDTGEIEVFISHLEILNHAETPPLEIDDNKEASEEMRLKYRYLDLRRPKMQNRLLMRHKAAQATREYLNSQSFMEIETPMLVKTTPGGARVFKVPSRVHTGKFYALPESPQLYKQLLMVSGCDRYYQFARCLRDEDLRADRQPEFTQIDLEMSFVETHDVQEIIEGLLKDMFKKAAGKEIKTPFTRITYAEAMEKYGSDKPDLRFGLELKEVTKEVKKSEFSVFKNAPSVKCLCVEGGAKFSRKDLEELETFVKIYQAKGLAYLKIQNGKLDSSIAKYFKEELQQELIKKTSAKEGDILLFVADKLEIVYAALGALRLELGKRFKLYNPDELKFCWVVDFPLYELVEEKWEARHHIFTMPREEDMPWLEKDPSKVRGKLYDVVLNGVEIGGGSIRIHNKEVQTRVLKVIGLSYEEAQERFDFLLEAFQYGAPPHGGIALGFDRVVALMAGLNDIREVIAFPKTKAAENPMDGSPQEWTEAQLKELHLRLDGVKKPIQG
ncbi:aspartate--tRNA ligase [Candidatus Woesearchaeota archaeon]|nr:aspartate--tRNA ligase [Candidatus Woesearchaeota archaeon]